MVSTSEVSISVTVDSNESIAAIAADLAKLADVKYEGRKAIVCLVGENIGSTPGSRPRSSAPFLMPHPYDFPGGFRN